MTGLNRERLDSDTKYDRIRQGAASNEAGSITWELRSVNHRYLEPGIKLPDEFRQLEPEIRKLLGQYLTRGKIDLSLRYKIDQQQQSKITLNDNIVRSLREVEQQVLNIVHEGSKLSVSDILGWPGVISEGERDISALLNCRRYVLKRRCSSCRKVVKRRAGRLRK